MIRTFIVGLFLGLSAAGALAYFVPVVDLHREASLVKVEPNGGNSEEFRVNLPDDRIAAGIAGADPAANFPAGLNWPSEEGLGGSTVEVFKLRNSNDRVIGLAARIESKKESTGPFVHWMLHLPARGSLFLQMSRAGAGGEFRPGKLVGGTREFELMSGAVREFYRTDVENADLGISGRLELVTSLVGPVGEQ